MCLCLKLNLSMFKVKVNDYQEFKLNECMNDRVISNRRRSMIASRTEPTEVYSRTLRQRTCLFEVFEQCFEATHAMFLRPCRTCSSDDTGFAQDLCEILTFPVLQRVRMNLLQPNERLPVLGSLLSTGLGFHWQVLTVVQETQMLC